MVRMDSFSSVPPHIQPPMAQVPSAIRELMIFVPLTSIYSCMLSLSFLVVLVSLATEHAWRDAIAAGQIFQFAELRLRFLHTPLEELNASFGSNAYVASI